MKSVSSFLQYFFDMKNIVLAVIIALFSFNSSVAQSKIKNLWNKVKNKPATETTEQNDDFEEEFTEEEEETETPVKEKKAKKQQKVKDEKQDELPQQTEAIDQNSYSWAEDQKLFSYLINEKKDYPKAIQVGKLMLNKTENAEIKELYQIGQSHSCLGRAFYLNQDYLSAHHHLLKAAEISEQLYGGSSLALANDFEYIANNYIGLKYKNQAASYLKTAIDIKLSFLGANNEQVKNLMAQYNALQKDRANKTSETDDATELKKEITQSKTPAPKAVASKIDTLYIYQKDTIVMQQGVVAVNSSSLENQMDKTYREEFIQEAIDKFNEQNINSNKGISEEEKQTLIKQITNNVQSSIVLPKSQKDTIIKENTVNYELDETTKREIIETIYEKIKADYPLIQGKNDTITIIHELNPKEKDELAKVVIANLNNDEKVDGPTKDNGNGTYYTVRKGDSLYGIAKRFNVTIESIKRLNNLVSNNLKIGTRLRVK